MKRLGKYLTFLLMIILCLQLEAGPLTSPFVHAADVKSGSWTYEVIKDGEADAVRVKGYKGAVASLTIPSTIDGMKVIEIGLSAFSGKTKLTSVVIPEGVKSIGNTAFNGCENLASITIPYSVSSIGAYAFQSTKWQTTMRSKNPLVVVNGILVDGYKASGQVTIPSDVHTIGDSAFKFCAGITGVVIPASVTYIGDYAFDGCDNLKSVTLPSGITRVGDWTFGGCDNLSDIVIPDGVTIIGESAFQECPALTSITLPSSLTEICKAAFTKCSGLTSVTIPGNVTNIDDTAFADCGSLASVNIPASVSFIAPNAFSTSPNVTIIAPRGSTAIEFAMNNKMKCLYPDGANPYVEKEAEKKAKEEKARAAAEAEAARAAEQARRQKAAADKKAAKARVSRAGAVKKFRVKSVKISRGKRTIKLKWKKLSGVSGYQLQLSPKKKYKGNAIKVLNLKQAKTSCTVRKLRADKKYGIRIRPFAVYTDEKGNTAKAYGRWTEIQGRK